jgi:hypothetical protein
MTKKYSLLIEGDESGYSPYVSELHYLGRGKVD